MVDGITRHGRPAPIPRLARPVPGLLDIHCRSQMAGRALAEIIGHGPMVFITQCALDQIGQHWCHAAQLGHGQTSVSRQHFGNHESGLSDITRFGGERAIHMVSLTQPPRNSRGAVKRHPLDP